MADNAISTIKTDETLDVTNKSAEFLNYFNKRSWGEECSAALEGQSVDYLRNNAQELLVEPEDLINILSIENHIAHEDANNKVKILKHITFIVDHRSSFPKELVDEAESFILNNASSIKLPLIQDNYEEDQLKAAGYIAGSRIDFMKAGLKIALDRDPSKVSDIMINFQHCLPNVRKFTELKDDYYAVSVISTYISEMHDFFEVLEGNQLSIDFIKSYLDIAFESGMSGTIGKIIKYSLENKNFASKEIKNEIVSIIKERLGGDYLEVISIWKNCVSNEKPEKYNELFSGKIAKCLNNIDFIEKNIPGGPKELYNTCGIANFDRYSCGILANQAEQLLNNRDSYIANISYVAFEHNDDSNDAFSNWENESKTLITKISSDSNLSPLFPMDKNGPQLLYLAGTSSKKLFNSLVGISRKKTKLYEQERTGSKPTKFNDTDTDVRELSWIIVGAHGTEDAVGDIDSEMLKNMVLTGMVEEIKKWFRLDERTGFVLSSCLSAKGGPRSIAAQLSSVFNSFVYGANFAINKVTADYGGDEYFEMPDIQFKGFNNHNLERLYRRNFHVLPQIFKNIISDRDPFHKEGSKKYYGGREL